MSGQVTVGGVADAPVQTATTGASADVVKPSQTTEPPEPAPPTDQALVKPSPAVLDAKRAVDELGEVPFDPENATQMMRLANVYSKMSVTPKPLQGKPYDILYVFMIGRSLGVSPDIAIRGIDIIDGKPQTSAQLLAAVIKKSPLCEYFEKDDARSNDDQVTWVTKRRGGSGRESSYTYTLKDAALAGLINKANWKGNPKPMMGHRAAAFLAREVYPDLVGGLYSEGELSDLRELDVERAKADIRAQIDTEAEVRKLDAADPLKARLSQRAAQRVEPAPAADAYPCARCRTPVVSRFGELCEPCRGDK